jgi:hypothetical protein
MLNLFVLIILKEFDDNYFNPDNPIRFFDEWVSLYIKEWVKYSADYFGVKI